MQNNNSSKITKKKFPIISYGIIVFRINPTTTMPEYLLICRKHTLGYVDFIRGKYNINNKFYILQMFNQMTNEEKKFILNNSFENIWKDLWGINTIDDVKQNNYIYDEMINSCEKFNKLRLGIVISNIVFDTETQSTNNNNTSTNEKYSLNTLVNESISWDEPEWGFPKGRKDQFEKDFDCAIREFCEETNISQDKLIHIKNLEPFKEIFIGSNYKKYVHYYYLMQMKYENDNLNITDNNFSIYEVSKINWLSFENSIEKIRDYNYEKINVLKNVHKTITNYLII